MERNQKGRLSLWMPFLRGLGLSDRVLNSFGMVWCVRYSSQTHGSLGSEGEQVGGHSENGLPPCELEGLEIKAFLLSLMCVCSHVRLAVGGWVGDSV